LVRQLQLAINHFLVKADAGHALEAAGIEFVDENGGGPGVRLKKPPKKRT
jgi:hypothetical protein